MPRKSSVEKGLYMLIPTWPFCSKNVDQPIPADCLSQLIGKWKIDVRGPVNAFLLLLNESSEDTSGTAGPPAPRAVFQPPSVTVQRDRAAPFERKPFVHGSF